MEVLMLRLDIFDEMHKYILDFWKEIMYTFGDNDALVFMASFQSYDDIARNISPELYGLCESYANLQTTLSDIQVAQSRIKFELRGESIDTNGTHDIIVLHPLTKEEEELKEEFYEINNSIRIIERDIEKLSKVILKERQKLWSHIDTLIINSYKQMLFDITGSDVFVQSFMKELLRYGMMRDLSIAKRDHDYDAIINITSALDGCIGDWICDIEQLVGATE